ncbi:MULTISPECIES: thymidylate synthase [unclassified Variovorax]|nr:MULTISPECIES: thymidylate synthase [unclassified Variovorax]VTU41625.1 Thymidylate synthase [Variovorax sp. PBL-H6]VTU44675.1 Thymidylate synthase [Variovorax sp. SRS16]KWT98344.1 Thymidylate synthase [Variovorax sp. WDL1]PNG49996.1 Thymidylate synthase [Variovorax sp. B2]PNG50868.1 Thymidylate synthase [Variovorax sp. B4]
MQQFHDMLSRILDEGVLRPNRTGIDTLFVPSVTLKFDMADGFPAITTKKLAWKTAKGELFGFFRGFTSAAQFRELGCKVWDGNANITPSWLANKHRTGEDDIGRSYPKQWTDCRDWREVNSQKECDELIALGYEVRAHDAARNVWVMRRGINQLEVALKAIMTNPTDRRIIINGWRPDEHDQTSIPVCHVLYQFLVDTESNTLHMCFFQRSFDTALAFNLVIGALLLEIMARLSGRKAGTMTQFIGDAHIYVPHIPGVKELLSREHFPQPTLDLGNIPRLNSVDEIPGVFARLDPEDVKLVGYQCHPAIKLDMAA